MFSLLTNHSTESPFFIPKNNLTGFGIVVKEEFVIFVFAIFFKNDTYIFSMFFLYI